ncbi:hypothetical protein K438DRAFT_1747955 [Mycena galopus ATCC 62051]|nr:hypothetical protein K438DRAFT_1747955 [Mycena galopus ATCC 62051]
MSASITRSELWNRDGSVVLQAENTQFRVHWSVLERNSSVFREMQGLPQPPEQPTVEGCPVVTLSDDPVDLEFLLKVLTFLKQSALPLPIIGALIRLGRKYDFQDLFHSAVTHLTSEYPATLEEYDAMSDDFKTIEWYLGVHFDVISLASENNILSVLPCAYSCILKAFDLNELFDGIARRDGTVASLSGLDFRRCVVARERLLIKQFQPGYTLGWAPSVKWDFGDCTASAQCPLMREALLRKYLDDADIWALIPPSLSRSWQLALCPACVRHLVQCMTAGRKKIWDVDSNNIIWGTQSLRFNGLGAPL